jgi:predicted MFS family arabinose efflux permease
VNRWVKSLIISDMVLVVSINLFAPIYAIFAEKVGGGIIVVGESWGLFAVTTGLFMIILGRLEEKMNKMRWLITSYGLYCVVFAFYPLISNVYELFLVQILQGIALAINVPAWDALYTVHMDKGKESTEWGAYAGTWYVTSGVAAALGAFIVSAYSFSTLFYIMLAISLISFFYMVYLSRKIRWKDA